MQEPSMAELLFNRPPKNQVCNDVADKNPKAGVLQVFRGEKDSQSTLHEQLSMCRFRSLLDFG